jgi:hypothetical protein
LASVSTTTDELAVVANVPLAPVIGAEKVTAAPGTGSLNALSTVTARSIGNADPAEVDWNAPSPGVIVVGAPATFSSENVTVLMAAGVDAATTVKAPTTVLAVRAGEVAIPSVSGTVALPAKLAEGPPGVVDTVKVTVPVTEELRVGALHAVLLAST